MKFNREKLQPGMATHCRTINPKSTGGLIRLVLTRGIRKAHPLAPEVWGNHDGIVVRKADGSLAIGDSMPIFSRINSLEYWEKEVNEGRYEIRVFRVTGVPGYDMKKAGELAAEWWMEKVNGTLYDIFAFPRLLRKLLFDHNWGTWSSAGYEWAHWCTEGFNNSWAAVLIFDGHGPLLKKSPTPATMEKRAGILPDKARERSTADKITMVECSREVMEE